MATATQLRQNQNRFSIAETSAMALNLPTGFQTNLLTNSLTSKLKQRRIDERNGYRGWKENSTSIVSAKPPKQARKGSKRASILVGGALLETKQERRESRVSAPRIGSGANSIKSENGALKSISRGHPRTDSANSEKLPSLSPTGERETLRLNSRRSSSAGRVAGRTSSMSGKFSNSTSFFPTTDSTCIYVEPSGADHTIKVVKRDGVFQPIDKYSTGRSIHQRESGDRGKRVMCDYDVLTLPYGDVGTAIGDGAETNPTLPVSRGRSDISKKSMRVSWHENAEYRFDGNNVTDCYVPDTTFTPVNYHSTVQNNNTNNNSNNPRDTMAFRKPIHSTGKSSIRSIGLNWTVPSVANDDIDAECQNQATPKATTTSTPSKPMWSWLLAPESRASTQPRKTSSVQSQNRSFHSSSSSKRNGDLNTSKASRQMPRSSSLVDVSRSHHRRDVNPVASAMAREGTSVSRTKWQVPSSTPSSEFMKQIKDIQSFYKIIPSMRSPRSLPKSQQSGYYHSSRSYRAKVEERDAGSDDDDDDNDEINDESSYDVDEYNAVMMNAIRYDDDAMTTGTTRKGYSNSSPTKSVSDYQP